MEKRNEKRGHGKPFKLVIAALLLCLISMIGASLIQTGGGKIKVKDLRWETTLGHRMSGLLFVPDGVNAENPAPAIVVSHGMYNNREMQDLNFVELSRRGFVVLSMDMFAHGNSENFADNSGDITLGMYEAVKMLDSISYVDSNKIGITGHSLGGMSSNVAVQLDNMSDRHLISAVLLNCADAAYSDADTGEYTNIYGNRDVGIVAAQYDEWFFTQDNGNGGTTAPRDFIHNSNAQSFLHFGTDPSGLDAREAYQMYSQEIDGKEAIRTIYNPAIIHPWSHFSQRSTVATIEFFTAALDAPNPISATNQIWQWKVLFNLLGVIGFGLFAVNFTLCMVQTSFFASLKSGAPVQRLPLNKKSALWFWSSLILGGVFGTLIYLPVMNGVHAHVGVKELVRQSSPWGIGIWASLCALFAILFAVISYRLNGRNQGLNLKERGLYIGLKKLGKTILLAIFVVCATYSLVFIADFFFKTDFRIWVLALKAFEVDKVMVALFPSALLFLIYYITNAVMVNVFNNNELGNKKWINVTVVSIFNAVPAIILLLLQYVNFFNSGHLFFSENMYIVWLFPLLAILPLTAVMSRSIYKATNNPYLPGIINGLLVAIISCTNTLTWY